MSDRPLRAVWAASRAAIRRRKLQTIIVGLVVMLSTGTVTVGLGLLQASSGPFDSAFARARGAHLSVVYDAAKVGAGQASGVIAPTAGPFQTTELVNPKLSGDGPPLRGNVFVVGRADQSGPVDRLTLTNGRWVRGPGEIVLASGFSLRPDVLGQTIKVPGLPKLTVVGEASSVTQTADAWVTPSQMSALRPTGFQLLYRLAAGKDPRTALASIKAALPPGAVVGGESYLTAKYAFERQFDGYIPFIATFGTLAVIVSVLIIVNAISGAVLSGYRHIGIMKALGFGPAQVALVYFVMIAVPAVVGCAVGLALGNVAADTLAATFAHDLKLATGWSVGLGTDVLVTVAVLAMVALSMLVPVMRAGRLPAVEAIGARGASGSGRGRRVQRFLARTGLPRPVSLGLALPFGRPARSALTFVVVFLGAITMVFGGGLYETVSAMGSAKIDAHAQVQVMSLDSSPSVDRKVQAMLRSQTGVGQTVAEGDAMVYGPGGVGDLDLDGYRGDVTPFLTSELLHGRLFHGPGETVAPQGFLKASGLKLGDTLDLSVNGHHASVRIVGVAASAESSRIQVDWSVLEELVPKPAPWTYWVRTSHGASASAVSAALSGPLAKDNVFVVPEGGVKPTAVIIDGLALTLTLGICGAVGLGILYTVVLMTRERTKEIGVLRAVGMTPSEVRWMMIISMGALGILAGIAAVPVGVFAHHRVGEYTGRLMGSGMEPRWIHVYTPSLAVGLALAGALLAVLASLLPAGWASRIRTATALRSE
jgi:putative ABC transport system permease protein